MTPERALSAISFLLALVGIAIAWQASRRGRQWQRAALVVDKQQNCGLIKCERDKHNGYWLLRADIQGGALYLSLVCSSCQAPVKELGRLANSVIRPPGGFR